MAATFLEVEPKQLKKKRLPWSGVLDYLMIPLWLLYCTVSFLLKFKARIFPKPLNISVKRKKCGQNGEERERRFCKRDGKVPYVFTLHSLRARPAVRRPTFPGQSSTAAPKADQFWSPWPAPLPANKEGFQDVFLFYSHDSHPSQPTFYISFKKLKKFKKERHTRHTRFPV